MDQREITGVLGRLLKILCASLPMYLEDARPWSRRGEGEARTALANLVADRQELALRVAGMIVRQGARPAPGGFPVEFTAVNDLSIDFLLGELVRRQRCDVADLERCVADLAAAPEARALAEEALGNTQGHLEILEGVTGNSDT